MTLVFLVVLLGMAALCSTSVVVPRRLRRPVDRGRCRPAGAQSLRGIPATHPPSRSSTATRTGRRQRSGITISNSSPGVNDTITVHLTRPAPGVFTKLFGVNSVTVGAHASARASLMQQAQYIAPIGVNLKHPKLKGTVSCPCFGTGNPTTLPLGKTGAPGAFDLLNVDGSHGGTGPDAGRLDPQGYSGYLPIGAYLSDPARSGLQPVEDALPGPPQHQSPVPRLRRDRAAVPTRPTTSSAGSDST
jgi:hypothetical protein